MTTLTIYRTRWMEMGVQDQHPLLNFQIRIGFKSKENGDIDTLWMMEIMLPNYHSATQKNSPKVPMHMWIPSQNERNFMFIHCSIFEEKYSEKRKVVFDCGNSSSSSSTKMTTEDTTSWDDDKLTHKYSAWKQAERAIMQSTQ